MQEIFKDVRNEVKSVAKTAWNLALVQPDAWKAAEFLNALTNYYKNLYTEEEIEFLQFYFNMQLEMMKK